MSSENVVVEKKEEVKKTVVRPPVTVSSASRKILNTVAEAKNKLRRKDVNEINDGMREAAKEEQLQIVRNAKNNVKTANEISKIQAETEILNEKNKQIPSLIKNMEMKTLQSQIDRKNDFNDALNRNKKEEIKNYKQKASNYRVYSMIASIISAITSCLGLWYEKECMKPDIILCSSFFVMICVSVLVNIVLNNIPYITKNFIEKSVSDITKNKKTNADPQMLELILKSGMYLLMGFGIGYSIFTNYLFWSSVNDNKFSCCMQACIFDVGAVVLSLMVYKYDMMDFSASYVEKINNIDNDILEKFENEQGAQTEKNENKQGAQTEKNENEQGAQTEENENTSLVVAQKNDADVIHINNGKKEENETEKKTNSKV